MGGALILDRDGVLLECMGEAQYLTHLRDMEWIPGSRQALFDLSQKYAIHPIIVVTNQAGIGKGIVSWDRVLKVNRRFFVESHPCVNGYYLCPHAPEDACDCRKPKPGLVLRAAHSHGFDPKRSLIVGDCLTDMDLADAVGAEFILVETGRGESALREIAPLQPVTCADFLSAVPLILEWWSRSGIDSQNNLK